MSQLESAPDFHGLRMIGFSKVGLRFAPTSLSPDIYMRFVEVRMPMREYFRPGSRQDLRSGSISPTIWSALVSCVDPPKCLVSNRLIGRFG